MIKKIYINILSLKCFYVHYLSKIDKLILNQTIILMILSFIYNIINCNNIICNWLDKIALSIISGIIIYFITSRLPIYIHYHNSLLSIKFRIWCLNSFLQKILINKQSSFDKYKLLNNYILFELNTIEDIEEYLRNNNNYTSRLINEKLKILFFIRDINNILLPTNIKKQAKEFIEKSSRYSSEEFIYNLLIIYKALFICIPEKILIDDSFR